jgi:hypothetical protein
LTGGLAGVENGADMGLLQLGRRSDLSQTALGAQRCGELCLERDRPIVVEIAGEGDRGHAPTLSLRSSV